MELISQREVAAMLSVARSTVYVLLRDHGLPKPLKIGGKRSWVKAEVVAWIAQRAEDRTDG